jgi:hypothetical protein
MKTPLPLEWVEKIFKKLTLVYGRDFQSRWEGLDVMEVKIDWAHELAGLQENPRCITHALQNLPPAKPPTVLEFRALALKCPGESVALLPLARLEPEVVAQHVARANAVKPTGFFGNKDWAHRIIARHDAGDKLLPYTLKCAQDALAPRSGLPA